MPNVRIRGHDIEVDVRTELEAHDFERPRWTGDKLIACSPFRSESAPSFFVNLDGEYAGTWGDSGAYDSEWASGNLTKLLAFLRGETYEETEEYLLDLYAPQVLTDDAKDFRIPSLNTRKVERRNAESPKRYSALWAWVTRKRIGRLRYLGAMLTVA